MRQLRDDTHLVLDGEVRVYRRERSKRWQASFVIDGHTIRISTGKRDLTEAKEYPPSCLLQHHCVLINTCETKTLENWMSIRLLEHMRDELIATGIIPLFFPFHQQKSLIWGSFCKGCGWAFGVGCPMLKET